jgi:hypothetical protein
MCNNEDTVEWEIIVDRRMKQVLKKPALLMDTQSFWRWVSLFAVVVVGAGGVTTSYFISCDEAQNPSCVPLETILILEEIWRNSSSLRMRCVASRMDHFVAMCGQCFRMFKLKQR